MSEINVTTTRPTVYKDLSLSLGMHPITNDVVTVTGEEAVKRAVKNLLMIQCGEVPFLPNLGTRLNGLLFEPIDPITTALLKSEIRATIEAFEPRVNIVQLVITPSEDEHQYEVNITFEVVNLPEPVTLTVFLTRLR